MAGDIRQPIEQLFVNFPLQVNTTPTPLNSALDINAYVQSFFICNPAANSPNSVFWGDGQVSASSAGSIGSGIEIPSGTTQQFVISQTRQLYEVQDNINDILTFLASQVQGCTVQETLLKIPVIVWNPSNFFLIGTVTTTVSVSIMRSVYI